VLGNGSNLLISDKTFHGVVIRLKGDFDRIESRDEFIEVGSGVLLPKLYSYALEHNLSGLEEGGLIPATIGGAVYMNAQTGEYITSNLDSNL
jgi:UDP-N-acetylmuramate dehydrogenase